MSRIKIPKLGDLDNFVYDCPTLQDNLRTSIETSNNTLDTTYPHLPKLMDEFAGLFGLSEDLLLLHSGDIEEDMRAESSQASFNVLLSTRLNTSGDANPATHTKNAPCNPSHTVMKSPQSNELRAVENFTLSDTRTASVKIRIPHRAAANEENVEPSTPNAALGPIRVPKRRTGPKAKSPYASKKKPVDEEDVPLSLKLPKKLVPIMCLYDGCVDTKEYWGREEWKKHLVSAHNVPGSSTARGRCLYPNCDEPTQKSSFIRHIVDHHSGVGCRCRQCEKLFSRPDAVTRHLNKSSTCDQYYSKNACLFDEEICLKHDLDSE